MNLFINPRTLIVVAIFCVWACGNPTAADDPGEACATDDDCVPSATCQIGVCDPATNECVYTVQDDYCLVDGACKLNDTISETDKCLICDASQSTNTLVPVTCAADKTCDSDQGCVSTSQVCGGDDSKCDDGDSCTTDTCGEGGLCEYAPNREASCDDGNECTTNDSCDAAGDCVGEWDATACDCEITADCTAAPPQCQIYACTDTACVLEDGPDDDSCDDGNACTANDTCQTGACTAGEAVECAPSTDPCLVAQCDPSQGCVDQPADADVACDDGNSCTTGDVCDGSGNCAGAWDSSVCACQGVDDCPSEAPACKQYACIAGQCVLEDVENDLFCDDTDACTKNEVCQGGVCGGGDDVICPDTGNVCTYGACDSAVGCEVLNKDASTTCNDGKACTDNDHCDAGACVSGGITSCSDNDSNPCTVPTCDENAGGCVEELDVGLQCMANNACVEVASCNANGECEITTTVTCPDTGNPCTESTCDQGTPLEGCEAGNINENGTCDTSSKCINGVCTLQDCVVKSDCLSKNTCGMWACNANQCKQTGSLSNGTSCGKSGVCWLGNCINPECTKATENADCDTDPCKVFECGNDYKCVQTQSIQTGTCGNKMACLQGECTAVACTANAHCIPKNANPCELYECGSNYTCYTSSKVSGSYCGKNKVCWTGNCITNECSNKDSNCPQDECVGYECQGYQCNATTSKINGSACKMKTGLSGKCQQGVCKTGIIIQPPK